MLSVSRSYPHANYSAGKTHLHQLYTWRKIYTWDHHDSGVKEVAYVPSCCCVISELIPCCTVQMHTSHSLPVEPRIGNWSLSGILTDFTDQALVSWHWTQVIILHQSIVADRVCFFLLHARVFIYIVYGMQLSACFLTVLEEVEAGIQGKIRRRTFCTCMCHYDHVRHADGARNYNNSLLDRNLSSPSSLLSKILNLRNSRHAERHLRISSCPESGRCLFIL